MLKARLMQKAMKNQFDYSRLAHNVSDLYVAEKTIHDYIQHLLRSHFESDNTIAILGQAEENTTHLHRREGLLQVLDLQSILKLKDDQLQLVVNQAAEVLRHISFKHTRHGYDFLIKAALDEGSVDAAEALRISTQSEVAEFALHEM
jgi:hypothetical protein